MAAQSFVRWLHGQSLADPDKTMPWADLYQHGPIIEQAIGIDGEFSFDRILVALREELVGAEAQACSEKLIHAEARWRMACLEMDPDDTAALTPDLVASCAHRSLRGDVCGAGAVPGTSRCSTHGGAVLDATVRQSVLLVAYAKMLQSSSLAVEALTDVAQFSGNDLARVHAAREILDRVGLVYEDGAHQRSEEAAEHSQDAVIEDLKSQLATARQRLQLVAAPDDDEVVEAEVVSDVG